MPFDIPVTFTIVPHDPLTDKEGFLRYAMRMNGLSEAEFHTILTGVIHGQTRILAGAACMSYPCSTLVPWILVGTSSGKNLLGSCQGMIALKEDANPPFLFAQARSTCLTSSTAATPSSSMCRRRWKRYQYGSSYIVIKKCRATCRF